MGVELEQIMISLSPPLSHTLTHENVLMKTIALYANLKTILKEKKLESLVGCFTYMTSVNIKVWGACTYLESNKGKIMLSF